MSISVSLRSLRSVPVAFEKVESQYRRESNCHTWYWWRTSGYALAILLDNAGYSMYAQCQMLQFVHAITPSLGAARLSRELPRWKSYMTDDHNPIELSWDWGTGEEMPHIRFSIEPVGVYAGTELDPQNQLMGSRFRDELLELLPTTNIEWLNYFRQKLKVDGARNSAQVHQSTEFYAFDLSEEGVVGKAYLFAGRKAAQTARSSLDVIAEAIEQAPECRPATLQALRVFQEYAQDPLTPPLEIDMLSMDLVNPADSRLKIYFRIRNQTSFTSIKEALSLGGRIRQEDAERGFHDLRQLYQTMLGPGGWGKSQCHDFSDKHLPPVDHETSGILYYVAFKCGSKRPKTKVYLPVRHYAKNDQAVISALDQHLRQSRADTNLAKYSDAMTTIL